MTLPLPLSGLDSLPQIVDLLTAAGLLGIGRTTAYQLARSGRFPVPVLRIGSGYKVPTAPLLDLLAGAVPEAWSASAPPPAARAVSGLVSMSRSARVSRAEPENGAGAGAGRCARCGRFFEPVEGS